MNPSCIEFYLTSCWECFESTLTTETGLSDFKKLIFTDLKHEKVTPEIMKYGDYKKFDSRRFIEKL